MSSIDGLDKDDAVAFARVFDATEARHRV